MIENVARAKADAQKVRWDDGIPVRVIWRDGRVIWSKIDDEGRDLTTDNSDGMLHHVRSVFVPHGASNPLAAMTVQAEAAIAAMQQAQQEVIAWRYERTDGFVILVSKRYTDQHPKGDGWTETPLYAHPPVPQWQGIESAPRDGTLILVPVGHGVMDVVSWWGGAWRETANALAIRDEPTHWMPLPTPPAGGSDAE